MGSQSDQVKGRVEQAAGVLTGNEDMESQGRKDRRAGEAKEKVDDAKAEVGEAVDKVAEKAEEIIERAKDTIHGD